jgi:hypothetical protein
MLPMRSRRTPVARSATVGSRRGKPLEGLVAGAFLSGLTVLTIR